MCVQCRVASSRSKFKRCCPSLRSVSRRLWIKIKQLTFETLVDMLSMENVDCSCQLQKNRLEGFSRRKILFPNLHWNGFFDIHATRTKPQEWDPHCNALPSNYQPPTSKCKHEYRSGKKHSVQVFHQKTLVVVGSWGAGIIDTLWKKYISTSFWLAMPYHPSWPKVSWRRHFQFIYQPRAYQRP